MSDPIQRYLEKRADLRRRPLIAAGEDALRGATDIVVVIPALAEGAHLFKTLQSLAQNPAEQLARTLVICVVNNRAPEHVDASAIDDNRNVLAALEKLIRESDGGDSSLPGLASLQHSALRLACIDASSPGLELAPKEGVGVARKIGLDWGVEVLRRAEANPGVLVCLDADTLVEPNYLAAIHEHFKQHEAWAAALAYAHRIEGDEQEQAAIVCYELFLRYHVLGLRLAHSPYAFHTIGSTIACTTHAYVAVSGMNRREAGEDFYFLQQLAKTGRVSIVDATTVYPSSRPSHRVPFGTGRRVRRFIEGGHNEYLLYHPQSYRILKNWIELVSIGTECEPATLLAGAGTIAPQLHAFLEQNDFTTAWNRLRANNPKNYTFLEQFHCWFDGFKTLKLFHYLRDNGFPEQDMFESIAILLDWIGAPIPALPWNGMRTRLDVQETLLRHLRTSHEVDRSLDSFGRAVMHAMVDNRDSIEQIRAEVADFRGPTDDWVIVETIRQLLTLGFVEAADNSGCQLRDLPGDLSSCRFRMTERGWAFWNTREPRYRGANG